MERLYLAYLHTFLWLHFLVLHCKSYLLRVCLTFSTLFNVVLGGELHQTFSSRNWERRRNKKTNLVWIIDFFFGDGHCMESWVKWQTKILKK